MNELDKIKERYERRKISNKSENFYFSYYACSERELKYLEILQNQFGIDFSDLKILEIGAGVGSNLIFFHRHGFQWQNIYANELLEDRFIALKKNLAEKSQIFQGDASKLLFKSEFDICFQSTVFTSILDLELKKQIARKMWESIKSGGIILWYDFKYNNPKNKDVKGVSKKEIKIIFPDVSDFKFYNVTLAPPIGKKIGKFYNFINNLFPFLRTHLICVITK